MMTIQNLRERYTAGQTSPADIVRRIFERIREEGERPVWITIVDEEHASEQAHSVDISLPLGGIPFAVKDNFDVAGLPTTAGCPSFAYKPQRTATVVQRLIDSGGILIGKTNMDQFATGLVGTRSPYGSCSSVYNPLYISGGSSSGSAIAVAKGLCAFSLGTDTAGSGRIPAAFNNLVGLKPTRGMLSADGVVPACRSLDCVSIFSKTPIDALEVWRIAQGPDTNDPFSRTCTQTSYAADWVRGSFRFGVPAADQLQFFGDDHSRMLYEKAIENLEQLGGLLVTIDFTPFREAGELLYSGPWVAERFAAVGEFLKTATEGVDGVVKKIILGGEKYSAADSFRSGYRLQALKKTAEDVWKRMDVLVVPTAGTIYTRDAIASDPVQLNANLGFYTNFVNLMDLAAVAVPAGFRDDGLPFGICLIGPACSDEALLRLAARCLGEPSRW
jgi:allophanate hydrolase